MATAPPQGASLCQPNFRPPPFPSHLHQRAKEHKSPSVCYAWIALSRGFQRVKRNGSCSLVSDSPKGRVAMACYPAPVNGSSAQGHASPLNNLVVAFHLGNKLGRCFSDLVEHCSKARS